MKRAVVFIFLAVWAATGGWPPPGAATAGACPGGCQSSSELPRANTVVKPRAYVSLERVPRGRAFEVAVVAEIQPGFHINANKVLQDYLIPTTVQAEVPSGLRLESTTYPAGVLQKFEFSEEKLSVYDGTVTIRMKLTALGDAPLGNLSVPLVLRYQACNDAACLPPVKLALAAELEIAPAGARVRPTHPEIFPKRSSKRT